MEVQPGFAITLQGKVYEKHKEAGEVLRGIIEGVTAFTRYEVGMYKGFQVSVQNDMLGPSLFLQGEKEYSVELKSSDSGNMVRIENRLNALDKAVEEVQKEIKTCENEIKNAKQEYEKPFPLFNIRGFPGTVDMMSRHHSGLDIGSYPQFFGTSYNNPFPSGSDIGKHAVPLFICFCIMDKADFFLWNTSGNQFLF